MSNARREAEESITPPAKVPRPPTWLKGTTRLAEWRYITKRLTKLLTEQDRELVAWWCDAKARYQEMAEILTAEGYVVVGGNKRTVRHPAVVVQKDALATMLEISRRLGLSPSDRASLGIGIARAEAAKKGKFDDL